MQKIILNYKGRKISLPVKKTNLLSKGIGLTFKTRNTQNLLFEFKRDVSISITSLCVFFPFLIVWTNSKNQVLGSEVIRPFRFAIKPKFKFRKFVEIPYNAQNRQILGFFDDKRKI